MTARVIAFINYKGGVAKTTTTYHIGCSLAQHLKKRVLLIDIDPQTNLTSGVTCHGLKSLPATGITTCSW
jgi:cellulose biosynthesis protein BcsQ